MLLATADTLILAFSFRYYKNLYYLAVAVSGMHTIWANFITERLMGIFTQGNFNVYLF